MSVIMQKRETSVLTLSQALKAAVSQVGQQKSSSMAHIAEKYGFNYATFSNCLNPTTPSHTPNIHHLEAVLAETKDGRILDSLCAIRGNACWFELPDVEVSHFDFIRKIGKLGQEMGDLASSVCNAIQDQHICEDELAVIQKDVFNLLRVTTEILKMTELASKKS